LPIPAIERRLGKFNSDNFRTEGLVSVEIFPIYTEGFSRQRSNSASASFSSIRNTRVEKRREKVATQLSAAENGTAHAQCFIQFFTLFFQITHDLRVRSHYLPLRVEASC